MPRTLLLDLDGTLVDTLPDLEGSLNRLMHDRGLEHFRPEEVRAMIGDGVAALLGKAFAARGGAPDTAALADFLQIYEARIAHSSRPYPGVPEGLADLAAQGWRLAVCTNKPEKAARELLTHLALIDSLSAIGGGDSFPVRKPDPAHLTATLALVGGDPARAVILGDHANDVVAARGADIPSIFAAWGYGTAAMAVGAAAVADHFADAVAIANRLVPPD